MNEGMDKREMVSLERSSRLTAVLFSMSAIMAVYDMTTHVLGLPTGIHAKSLFKTRGPQE